MQKAILVGNLGADAEIKETNGSQFIAFKVADSRKWSDASGADHEETVWYSCTLNASNGGSLLPYLKKGTKVLVIGRQTYNVYSSKQDRCMKAGVRMFVESLELLQSNSDAIPHELVSADGQILTVYKAYYIHPDMVRDFNGKELFDKKGNIYEVDKNGFLTARQQTASDTQQADNAQEYQGY